MPNVLSTLMRHPKLVGPLLVYNAVLLERADGGTATP